MEAIKSASHHSEILRNSYIYAFRGDCYLP
jgi:hypothetical protein